MRKSKLEFYEDIICTLARKALTIDDLAFHCNMNCTTLQQRLEFLVKNNITSTEIGHDNRKFYTLTRRGLAIFKTFCIARFLEKHQTSAKQAEQSLQEIPAQPEKP